MDKLDKVNKLIDEIRYWTVAREGIIPNISTGTASDGIVNSISALRHEFISLQDELAEAISDRNRYKSETDETEDWWVEGERLRKKLQAEREARAVK
jgi:hypothetical protein